MKPILSSESDIYLKLKSGLFGMLIMLISLILASVITNCVFIFKSGGWTTYQIYNRDFYNRAHAAVSNLLQLILNYFLTVKLCEH